MTAKLVLCDDQMIVTDGMQMILGAMRDLVIVGVAHDGAAAVELVDKHRPDLVLMDLRMPIMNGIQATRQIRQKFPATRVLVLTTYDDDEWVFDAIRAGASGYLLKDATREQILAAIKGTLAGVTHVDPKVAAKLFQHVAQSGDTTAPSTLAVDLNEREQAILRLLAQGLANSDMAERLHLSKGTIQNYLGSIFAKLDVADRTQAVVVALRHGLIKD